MVRILQTGKGYTLTYTNLVTMESVTIRPTGSIRRTVVNSNGTSTVTKTGTAGIISFPLDTPPGPSTIQYYGRIVYTLGTDGSTLLSLKTTGTSGISARNWPEPSKAGIEWIRTITQFAVLGSAAGRR